MRNPFLKSVRGLRDCLREYNDNGHFAQRGKWSIARGGYDCMWEINYNGTPVIGKLSDKPVEFYDDTFTEAETKRIKRIITEEYDITEFKNSWED